MLADDGGSIGGFCLRAASLEEPLTEDDAMMMMICSNVHSIAVYTEYDGNDVT